MIDQIWWGAKQNKSAIATESACGTCTWVNFKQEMFSESIFFYIDFSLASWYEGCRVQIPAL